MKSRSESDLKSRNIWDSVLFGATNMKGTEGDTRSVHSTASQTTTDSVKRKRHTGSIFPRFWQSKSKARKGSTDSDHSGSITSMTPPPKSNRRVSATRSPGASSHLSSASRRSAGSTTECPLCLMERPKDQFPEIMTCEHRSCRECLRQYLKIEITESRVNIACPECAEPLHPNDIKMVLQDDALMSKYEEFTLRRLLMVDPDCRWCPAPDCGFAVLANGCASCPQLFCQRRGCGTSFCYHCKQIWHPNQTCDAARQQRSGIMRKNSLSYSQGSASPDQIKPCPRCTALIIKMDDGSCNHMTCAVCGAEFCWLCMKEISDLHYLSPSGCTFWGKKPWSRKKKILWQLGTLVGAPVGIALIAGIAVPAIIIGIPVYVGRKVHAKYAISSRHRRNLAIAGSVSVSILVSPIIAALTVGIGVPIMLAYVYGVVPVSLCRSGGCGVTTSNSGGVRIEFDDDNEITVGVTSQVSDANPDVNSAVVNASIGEASMTRESTSHLEVAGVLTDDTVSDNASTRAIAGASLTGSLSGSGGVGPMVLNQHRMDVHAEMMGGGKRCSFSSESASLSLGDNISAAAAVGTIQEDGDLKATDAREHAQHLILCPGSGVAHASERQSLAATGNSSSVSTSRRTPLEVHVDIEKPVKSRHGSGSSSSTEHSQPSAASARQQPAVPQPSTEHPEDVWELKSSMGGVVRKSKGGKTRRHSGKKNSVKISDRISEAPSYLQDNISINDSINDSINSELSAAAPDSECPSECSSTSNYEGVVQSQSNVNDSKWKSIGDPSDSFTCTSTQSCQIATCNALACLTEVENDRPSSHFSARINRGRSASTSSIPTGRVMSTDL